MLSLPKKIKPVLFVSLLSQVRGEMEEAGTKIWVPILNSQEVCAGIPHSSHQFTTVKSNHDLKQTGLGSWGKMANEVGKRCDHIKITTKLQNNQTGEPSKD